MTTFCCERNALFFLAVAERATHARSAALSCQTVLSKENNGFLPGRTHGYDPTHTIIIHCTKRKPHTLGVNAACVGFTYISRNHYKGRRPDSALCFAEIFCNFAKNPCISVWAYSSDTVVCRGDYCADISSHPLYEVFVALIGSNTLPPVSLCDMVFLFFANLLQIQFQ